MTAFCSAGDGSGVAAASAGHGGAPSTVSAATTAQASAHTAAPGREGRLGRHARELLREAIRLADVVAVHAREIRAARLGPRALERGDDSERALAQHAHAAVARSPGAQDIRCLVP